MRGSGADVSRADLIWTRRNYQARKVFKAQGARTEKNIGGTAL